MEEDDEKSWSAKVSYQDGQVPLAAAPKGSPVQPISHYGFLLSSIRPKLDPVLTPSPDLDS